MTMKKLLLVGLILMATVALAGCFAERTVHDLTIQIQGQGVVKPEQSGEYSIGTVVDLQAWPAEGWKFYRWEGEVAEPFAAETTILINGSKTVKAVFAPDSDPVVMEGPGGLITWRANGSQVRRRPQGESDIQYIMIHAISDAAANPQETL